MVYLKPFFLLLWEYFWKYDIWDEGSRRLTAGGFLPTSLPEPSHGCGLLWACRFYRWGSLTRPLVSQRPERWLVEARPAVTREGCGQGLCTCCGSWGSAGPPGSVCGGRLLAMWGEGVSQGLQRCSSHCPPEAAVSCFSRLFGFLRCQRVSGRQFPRFMKFSSIH